jgi:hypothetical protein
LWHSLKSTLGRLSIEDSPRNILQAIDELAQT